MTIQRKKILTFDGPTFWKNAYAHQRAKVLRMVNTPDDKITEMTSMKYLDLPLDVRYDIETSPDVDQSELSK